MVPPVDGSLWKDVYLVVERMDTDLHYILHSGQALGEAHVQWMLYQLCAAREDQTCALGWLRLPSSRIGAPQTGS